MSQDLSPEYILKQLEKRQLPPLYLFYGPSEFRLEKALNRIRENFIPEGARDFNLQIFYGVKTNPEDVIAAIINSARTFPFLANNRLIIVRRTEDFSTKILEGFLPYLDDPVESTCLIFVAPNPDFRKKFYKKIRGQGRAVNFRRLFDNQIVPWIKSTARELGFNIEDQACTCLQQIVGNRLIDLYSELEKLYLRHGNTTVGMNEVKDLAIYSRTYSIFELMDKISLKRCAESLSALDRFMEDEGRGADLKAMGMLNRQIRLLWQTRSVIENGGRSEDVGRKLKLQPFQVKHLVRQARIWSTDDIERAFHLLYETDRLLKSGAQSQLVLENLVISLCNY